MAASAAAMNTPAFYQQDGAGMQAANKVFAALQARLEQAYARWSELE